MLILLHLLSLDNITGEAFVFSHKSIIYFSAFDSIIIIFLESGLDELGNINFTRSPSYHESCIAFMAGLLVYCFGRQLVVEDLRVATPRIVDVNLV